MLFRRCPGLKASENKYFATRINVRKQMFGEYRLSKTLSSGRAVVVVRRTALDHVRAVGVKM